MDPNTGHVPYASVNGEWPKELPVPTAQEAVSAVRRLYRFGTGKPWRGKIVVTSGRRHTWPRRGVFYVNPNGQHFGGWRDIVHNVSHYCHWKLYPSSKPHDHRHHFLEKEMIKYVVKSGWLEGKLKRPEKPQKPKRDEKRDRVAARIKKWETKRKRAETALRKLKKTQAYYERT